MAAKITDQGTRVKEQGSSRAMQKGYYSFELFVLAIKAIARCISCPMNLVPCDFYTYEVFCKNSLVAEKIISK